MHKGEREYTSRRSFECQERDFKEKSVLRAVASGRQTVRALSGRSCPCLSESLLFRSTALALKRKHKTSAIMNKIKSSPFLIQRRRARLWRSAPGSGGARLPTAGPLTSRAASRRGLCALAQKRPTLSIAAAATARVHAAAAARASERGLGAHRSLHTERPSQNKCTRGAAFQFLSGK